MRTIPTALAAHLDGEATTVCHCWRVICADGVVLGFTEHDGDLVFAGTTYRAASGFLASDSEQGTGLGAEAGEVTGGFSSAAILEADVVAGRYDGARVETYLVNWQAPGQHVRLRVEEIGEVVRAGDRFRAELRRQTHRLDQLQGRVYGRRCDAAFGDARCRVDAEDAAYRREGAVVAVLSETLLRVSGLSASPDGFFRLGEMHVLTGENAGARISIENHVRGEGGVTLSLWLPPPLPLVAGDTFAVTAGCDKSFATCGEKFGNRLNFQGFPHMPGMDFAYGYADGDTVHDGRPLHDR
ncbi:DUF2163 domain-containing protein [Ensifer soli]|uniref:DUF2163 domain-containing protein n=1 Tax=Ciceribacter sp. sgz301302 TaxID=3342379 RepID=UPI0035BA2B88